MNVNWWSLPAVGLLACSGSSEPPPVFGGEGAQVESPGEVPLEEGQGELALGPCSKPAAPNTNTMLEDFEDGDNHLFKVYDRDGWWFTATDDTSGTVEPPRDQFKPAALPETEATADNRYAAHLTAAGFTDWGAVWGTTLEWKKEGLKCPYNASAFTGLRFRAKGSGRLRLNLGNPATIPPENGGSCKQGCYDTHGKLIDLTPVWTWYTVPFEKLQQGGWGAQAPFDVERLLSLNFAARPEDLPVDVWVDDLTWIDASTPPAAPAPAPAPATTVNPASTAPALTSPKPTATASAATTAPAPAKP